MDEHYRRLIDQVLEARFYVEMFCSIYRTNLVRILPTRENEKLEPMYVFNDNLGGYTLDGLMKSIEEHDGRIGC
ncbi:MAG: hypothetical protein V1906_01045 [Candidatus Woesearchaeota archaeon]